MMSVGVAAVTGPASGLGRWFPSMSPVGSGVDGGSSSGEGGLTYGLYSGNLSLERLPLRRRLRARCERLDWCFLRFRFRLDFFFFFFRGVRLGSSSEEEEKESSESESLDELSDSASLSLALVVAEAASFALSD